MTLQSWNEILTLITQTVLIPILSALAVFIVKWINVQARKIQLATQETEYQWANKYIEMLDSTINDAVIAVNQTYVDALKEKNGFDVIAQQEALRRVREQVKAMFTDQVDKYMGVIIGDLDSYIETKIESAVKTNKVPKININT